MCSHFVISLHSIAIRMSQYPRICSILIAIVDKIQTPPGILSYLQCTVIIQVMKRSYFSIDFIDLLRQKPMSSCILVLISFKETTVWFGLLITLFCTHFSGCWAIMNGFSCPSGKREMTTSPPKQFIKFLMYIELGSKRPNTYFLMIS